MIMLLSLIVVAFAFCCAALPTGEEVGNELRDKILSLADVQREMLGGGFLRKAEGWVDKVKRFVDPSKRTATPPTAVGSTTATTSEENVRDAADATDASDGDKKKSDDALAAATSIWKKAKDELAKDPLNELKKKAEADASGKLDDAQRLWNTARSAWKNMKSKLTDTKNKWEKDAAPIVSKVGQFIKAHVDNKSLLDDAKDAADQLKADLDAAWQKAKAWLKAKLAELAADPNNATKKAAVVSAQQSLDAASAAKVTNDQQWQQSNSKWQQGNNSWRSRKAAFGPALAGQPTTAGLTIPTCSAALEKKGEIDLVLRKVSKDWRKARKDMVRAKDALTRKAGDKKATAELKAAQSAYEAASLALESRMTDWETRTSDWCAEGMYCANGGPQTPSPVDIPPADAAGASTCDCPGYTWPVDAPVDVTAPPL